LTSTTPHRRLWAVSRYTPMKLTTLDVQP